MIRTNNQWKQKPVIFLAFSNDKPDSLLHLRKLSKEMRGIRQVLNRAKKSGLCEVVARGNATIEDILDVFQDASYQDRVAIFHFGGHANGYKLLVESIKGGLTGAYREGLASFLAHQKGLKFIFLNGCSSEQHALELTQAGVPAVVGTSQLIADEVAVNLSIRFYNGIANGFSLERAWKEAVDYIKIQKGTFEYSALYWQGMIRGDDRFPWHIYYKKGGENVKGWNLPEAANDPLFGLPEIPPTYGLPETPFLFLKGYERRHAKIFFGRSFYIRRLYDRIIDPKSPPIILFYGQSGVGKTSILDAGIIPRLEYSHVVIYARRILQRGLLGTLEDSLHHHSLKVNQGNQIDHISSKEKWKLIESKTNKSLVIIIDQAEEMYTRPNREIPNEFNDFLETLQLIFAETSECPKGKLILVYRKEYHSEIDKSFDNYFLPRECLFLEPLSRKDIIEVVIGLTQKSELKRIYHNLEVEANLPVVIADDLLEDINSPIAPVLQILMTKMWHSGIKENSHHVKFTVKKYQQLRKQGIAMEDFLKQQMEELKEWNSSVVDSGLALDVLKYHTTELGTACIRNIENIRQVYQHRQDIDELLQKLKNLYLLTDVYSNETEISLAHDILAPVVIKEYTDSDKPGQRASRILATKVEEYKREKNKIWLDEVDLEIVEQGKSGMKVLDEDKEKLLEISRQRKARREKVRKRIIKVGVALITFIILLSIFAIWQWQVALNETKIAKANYLASKAQIIALKDPTIALRVAERARKLDKSNQTATESIRKIYRENNFYKIIAKHDDAILSIAYSPDGKLILTGSSDKTACLWDFQGNKLQLFKGHEYRIQSVTFSPDGQYILTGSDDYTARLWDLLGNQLQVFKHEDNVKSVTFSPDGQYILTGSYDDTARLWDLQGNQLHIFKHITGVESVTFSPNYKYILTGTYNGNVCLWDLKEKELKVNIRHHESVYSVAFSPDGKNILAGSEDSTAFLCNLEGKKLQNFVGHENLVISVDFSPNGNYILTGSYDGTARLWNLRGEELQVFRGHDDSIGAVSFSPDGNYIITGSLDNTFRLWRLKGKEIKLFRSWDSFVSVAFSPNGNYILTGSEGRITRLWDLHGNQLQVFKREKSETEQFDFMFTPDLSPIAFSPDGKYILTGYLDGTVRLWDMEGKELKIFKINKKIITSINFSPDGKYIIIGSQDKTVRLISLKGKEVLCFSDKDEINNVLFSPDGKNILTVSGYLNVCLWNLKGEKLQTFRGHEKSVRSVAFSPDGKNILTGSFDKTARLWDLQGNQLRILKHESFVESVAFSLNANLTRHTGYVLIGCYDGIVRIWDLQGNQLQIFRGHEGIVQSVAFSPNSNHILTGSTDSTARLWLFITLEDFLESEFCEKLTVEQIRAYGVKD